MGFFLGWVCFYKDFFIWMLTFILLFKYIDLRVYCFERVGYLIFYILKLVVFFYSFIIFTCVFYSG